MRAQKKMEMRSGVPVPFHLFADAPPSEKAVPFHLSADEPPSEKRFPSTRSPMRRFIGAFPPVRRCADSSARIPYWRLNPNEAALSAVDGVEQDFLGCGGALFPLRHLEGVEDVAPMLRLVNDARNFLR